MSIREALVAEIPFLRRYSRALTGSQTLGDAAVREVLEALLEAPEELQSDKPVRAELFRIFHHLWKPEFAEPLASKGRSGTIASFPVEMRQSLLLTAVEGFSIEETAGILGIDSGEVDSYITSAREAISDALSAEVLIIEDESIIAMHIKQIVESLGHTVVGVVRTHSEAVAAAKDKKPELVLADISLADGSSGIDAVKDILAEQDVPVIFITAFPERLLTGARPEPTYLITKPFEPETVMATIGQALLLHRGSDGEKISSDAGTFSAA